MDENFLTVSIGCAGRCEGNIGYGAGTQCGIGYPPIYTPPRIMLRSAPVPQPYIAAPALPTP